MTRTKPDGIVRPRIAAEGENLARRLRNLLDDLTGRTVKMTLILPDVPAYRMASSQVVAQYAVEGKPDRFLIADLDAIAALGGARAMFSHGAVEAALNEHEWPEALVDNCLDVLMNVAQLWDRSDRRVRLVNTYGLDAAASPETDGDPNPLPDAVRAALESPARSLLAEITVAGYGSGRIALLRAAKTTAK